MLRRTISRLVYCGLAAAAIFAAVPARAQYRGMTPGWPTSASGYYTAYAPAYGYGQAYTVARPVQYQPVQYVPVRTAYANPAYYGTYAAAPVQYQQPVAAYYAPSYAPTTAYYAAAPSYTASPAGNVSSGAEAYAGYGQPTTVNYVPPRFSYRTVYSPVTVYSYRPVTAYDPITAQPTTCLQPSVSTACQPARQRHCLWWLNPCNWFSEHWGGSSSGCCGAPAAPVAPTTSYCGAYTCAKASCAQPYYPAQPVVPVVPAVPVTPAPANTIPSIRSPIMGTPTVPAPPTRFNTVPGATQPGVVVPGSSVPADTRPSLTPGGSFTPSPGGTFTPAPGAGSGSFSSGGNYPPATDPYLDKSLTPATPAEPATPPANRGSFSVDPRELDTTGPILRQPGTGGNTSALRPEVQPVPDPEFHQPAKAMNRAPQLLDPRDKSARRASDGVRWAVVPAVWPKKPAAEPRYEPRSLTAPASAPAVNPADYDDSGWKAGF